MKNALILFSFLIFCCSCSSVNRKDAPPSKTDCIDEKKAAELVEKLTNVNNTMSALNGKAAEQPTLLEQTCTKRKYLHAGRQIVVYRDSNGDVSAKTTNANRGQRACLDKALADISKLNESYATTIIAEHKKRYPIEWSDSDLAPDGWLHCDTSDSDYHESLATFLHELTHDLKNKDQQCLFLPIPSKFVCFSFGSNLPKRSYAKRTSFPTTSREALAGLPMVQKVYLTDIDQPLLSLVDELNAYTVSCRNLRNQFVTFGKKVLLDDRGKRPGILVTLFMNYTARYLDRLRKESNELYQNTFIENEKNREGVKTLLGAAENEYSNWLKILRKNGEKERDWESNLHSDYQSLIRKSGIL